MPTRKQIDDFVNPALGLPVEDNNDGWTFDSELGWIHKDAVRLRDGLDGSDTYYHFDHTRARRRVHDPDGPCRIRAYGNSFTLCDQVNDVETWQEQLSVLIDEPVENYGVGAYSVYQAYLRMRRIEALRPAKYVILNVYCDDHFRNLDAWRTIRTGNNWSPCCFPLPHLRLDPFTSSFIERPNPTPTRDAVYRLLDESFVFETFADDPVLHCTLASKHRRKHDGGLPKTAGLAHAAMFDDDNAADFQKQHAAAGMLATQRIIEMIEVFLARQGSEMMVILSHNRVVIANTLQHRPRWDQLFLDYMDTKPYPVIDMIDEHATDFGAFDSSVEDHMRRLFVGDHRSAHYSAAGNSFMAEALRRPVLEWLA